jgi:hypothetical protein
MEQSQGIPQRYDGSVVSGAARWGRPASAPPGESPAIADGPGGGTRVDPQDPATVSDRDRVLLGSVAAALADGRGLKQWWERTDASGGYAQRFDLARTFNSPDRAFGFFDEVAVGGRTLPVMGVVQEMLYDRPKTTKDFERTRNQLREFVLHYFMRVSDYREPEAFDQPPAPAASTVLAGLSWCPTVEVIRRGFGFSQLFSKRRDAAWVERFSERSAFAILDLREVARAYDWLLCKVDIFDFSVSFRLLGREGASLVVPLRETNYIVVSPDFIADRDAPESGVLGEYGLGYALIKYVDRDTVFGYGPGLFDAGFQLINFKISTDGTIRVRLVFVVTRPGAILSVPFRPVGWGIDVTDLLSFGLSSRLFGPIFRAAERFSLPDVRFDPLSAYVRLANLLTGGRAGEDFCISREQLEHDFLVQHFSQHYRTIVGSLMVWRRVPDWLDPEGIPHWATTGVTS